MYSAIENLLSIALINKNICIFATRIQIASANLRKLFVKAFYRCGKI